MRESRSSAVSRLFFTSAALLGVATLAPQTASAQYIGGKAPPLPVAPPAGALESPSAALSRAVRVLAANPRDFNALITAGRAELELGDLDEAVGFFGRADEIRPNDPAPKVGMGAAIIQTGDARGALQWFDQAQRLGASPALLGADRGLAHDLLGELSAAQTDYRAALSGPNAIEARRRFALSLAMSGNMEEALRVLSPLVVRSDPAALRTRAFVLALSGQQQLATQAIDRAMPGSSSRISPFFSLLPRLSIQQKAAAVHLGVFPNAAEMQLAAATPVPAPQPARPVRGKKPKETKLPVGRRTVVAPTPVVPVATTASPAPQPVAVPAPVKVAANETPAIEPVQQSVQQVAAATAIVAPPLPSNVAPTADASKIVPLDRLSGIDRLLAQADVPPPSRPKVERSRSSQPAGPTAAEKKAAERKAAAEKKAAADKKAKAEAASLGVAGTHWVQLAGGRNEDRMATEYKRLQGKSGSPLKGRSGYVSQGKDYFRLLVGPFDDAADAREFVNKLAKAKVDGFSWTRTPAQIKIEKLKL